MFKKFFVGALTAVILLGFGAFTEATQVEQQNVCCGSGYGCASDCDGDYSGQYCGRYGCGR